jgi:hypothetical protein
VRTGLVTLLAVGCSFHPGLAPDAPGGDDDDGGGPLPGSDAGVYAAPTCGTPGSLQADFTGSTLDPLWLAIANHATYTVGSNAITITVTDNGAMSGVLLYALPFVNLTAGELRVEVVSPLPSPGITELYVQGPDPMHLITMAVTNGTLQATVIDGGPPMMGSASYDVSAPYWWSLFDDAGQFHIRISQDQQSWTDVLPPMTTPSFVSSLRPVLEALAGAGSASFAQVDTAQGSAPWCDADTLHDTFATDQAWLNSATSGMPPPCMYTFGSDGIVKPTKTATCYLGSTAAYNLVNSSFVVAWGSGSASPTFVPLVSIGTAASYAEVYVDGADASSYNWTPQTQAHVWDPAGSDAFWRVSESGGTLTFENSATGSAGSWSTLATGPDPFDLSSVLIELGASATSNPAANQQVTFLGVN